MLTILIDTYFALSQLALHHGIDAFYRLNFLTSTFRSTSKYINRYFYLYYFLICRSMMPFGLHTTGFRRYAWRHTRLFLIFQNSSSSHHADTHPHKTLAHTVPYTPSKPEISAGKEILGFSCFWISLAAIHQMPDKGSCRVWYISQIRSHVISMNIYCDLIYKFIINEKLKGLNALCLEWWGFWIINENSCFFLLLF